MASMTTWSIGYGWLFGKTDFSRGDKDIFIKKKKLEPQVNEQLMSYVQSLSLFIL